MIDDILDLSRIEAGGLSLSPEDVDVARLVSECVGLIAPQAARSQFQIIAKHFIPLWPAGGMLIGPYDQVKA